MKMRMIPTIILISLFISKAIAQLPNGDFEHWTNGEPDGWYTNNFASLSIITVTQSSDAHSGSSALMGGAITLNTGIYYSLVALGKFGEKGIPVSERHANVNGFYKLIPVGDDFLSILVVFYKNGKAVGIAGQQYYQASTYTSFSIPILYTTNDVPDTCLIDITLGNLNTAVHSGSVFYLDDISFEGIATTSVSEGKLPLSFNLDQNYPNPFNPSTKISWQSPVAGWQSLKVYDILGNEVSTLVDEFRPAGNYTVVFNSSSDKIKLSSGVYFYRLNLTDYSGKTGSFIQTKKMILTK